MSTISDAMQKKRRDDDDRPSPDSHSPRLVRVEVPKDHTMRNMLLGTLVAALLLTGLLVGGYTILDRMGAFDRRPAAGPTPNAPMPPGRDGQQPGPNHGTPAVVDNGGATPPDNAATESGTPPLPTLQGILGGPVDPAALINGRRVRPGDVVGGYTLKAIGEDHVVLERDGKLYERRIGE